MSLQTAEFLWGTGVACVVFAAGIVASMWLRAMEAPPQRPVRPHDFAAVQSHPMRCAPLPERPDTVRCMGEVEAAGGVRIWLVSEPLKEGQ